MCFSGTGVAGVKSNIAINAGSEGVYYFEAKRWSLNGVRFGVSGSAPAVPASGQSFGPSADALMIIGTNGDTSTASGSLLRQYVGDVDVYGFVIDARNRYPVVSIIAPASVNPGQCPGLAATAPCVLMRAQLASTTGALHFYAWGENDGAVDARLSLNTGSDLVQRPYTYDMAAVRKALRTRWVRGDHDFAAQWPGSGGSTIAPPSIAAVGHAVTVVRQGDATPYRGSLQVTTNAASGTVSWVNDNNGGVLGTGTALPLSATLQNSLGVGTHPIIARILDTSIGRANEVSMRLVVLASVANTDDDGDGLSYDQEKTRGTDPGNPDTDNDGLADGAEVALGTNPNNADSDGNGVKDGHQLAGNGALPLRTVLQQEAGTAASTGVVVSDDATAAAFTVELNQDCVQRKAPFTDPVYGDIEICKKRGVRTNVGIKAGEFRYFETRRLAGVENLGHGFVSAGSPIDPVCCYVGGVYPQAPHPLSSPSLEYNSVGGVFVKLVFYSSFNFYPDFDLNATVYQGFVVNYRAADPVGYVVMTGASGQMVISEPLVVTGFSGGDLMPFVYGHPASNLEARTAINMGQQKFHYDPAAIRAALSALSVNMQGFVPGVGIHRW